MRHWLFAAAAAMFFLPPREVAGQTKAPPRPTTPTTRSGIYSLPQAERGADVYTGYCRSCHTPQSHTGATFNATWSGRRLSDMFVFIRDKMPKNDPGSLSEQEYIDVLAYILKMNRMPSGKSELPSDSAKLSIIRIVTTQPVRKEK